LWSGPEILAKLRRAASDQRRVLDHGSSPCRWRHNDAFLASLCQKKQLLKGPRPDDNAGVLSNNHPERCDEAPIMVYMIYSKAPCTPLVIAP
jgi:hypothetical protein